MTDALPYSETILDRCINAIYDQGKSVDDCLSLLDSQRETLEPLLRLTERLQAARQLTAPSDFRMTAAPRMESLIADLAQDTAAAVAAEAAASAAVAASPAHTRHAWPTGAPKPASTPTHAASKPAPTRRGMSRPAWVFAVGLIIVFVLLLGNTTASLANRAVPGDAFFPIKRAAENIQVVLAPSAAQDAALELSFTERRFAEVVSLLEAANSNRLEQAVQQYQAQLKIAYTYTGSDLLTPAQKEQVAAQLAAMMTLHERTLVTLIEALPQDHPDLSPQTLMQIKSVTSALLDAIQSLYTTLYHSHPDLPEPGQFILFPSQTATVTATATAARPSQTETPRPALIPSTATPRPVFSPSETGAPEWPTMWPSAWPTQWATTWATLVPTGYYTEIPGPIQTTIATLWPTYLPTLDLGDDNPGWPTDLPTDWPKSWPTESATDSPPSQPQPGKTPAPPSLPSIPTGLPPIVPPDWPPVAPPEWP